MTKNLLYLHPLNLPKRGQNFTGVGLRAIAAPLTDGLGHLVFHWAWATVEYSFTAERNQTQIQVYMILKIMYRVLFKQNNGRNIHHEILDLAKSLLYINSLDMCHKGWTALSCTVWGRYCPTLTLGYLKPYHSICITFILGNEIIVSELHEDIAIGK